MTDRDMPIHYAKGDLEKDKAEERAPRMSS
jgi:hypothetical protein